MRYYSICSLCLILFYTLSCQSSQEPADQGLVNQTPSADIYEDEEYTEENDELSSDETPQDEKPISLKTVKEKEEILGLLNAKSYKVYTKDEEPISISLSENRYMCIMATWCPYSEQVKNVLNDPELSIFLMQKEIIFLFADEWLTIKEQFQSLVDEGEFKQEEADELIEAYKARSDWGPLFDYEFLDGLKGKHYYIKEDSKITVRHFPDCFSNTIDDFNLSAAEWLVNEFNVPQNIAIKLVKKHAPKQEE